MQRTYLAIDLKSYYASAECAARHLDPLTTNLVVADSSRTEKTICLAVSPSLKAYGIPGRARLFEVVQKVKEVNANRLREAVRLRKAVYKDGKPSFSSASYDSLSLAADPSLELSYLVAPPRMAYYEKVSRQIYGIYLKYIAPEDIVVYSIDEVFIDATSYLSHYNMTAHDLAMTIIREVLYTTGITATAGIGTNLYLAKLAMDITAKHAAPDKDRVRIAELDEESFRYLLWDHKPLTDFWMTGPGTVKRLEKHGIHTMGELAYFSTVNQDILYKEFGVDAELLIDHAWGLEPCGMKEIKAYRPSTNSISEGQVLSCPYPYDKARIIVMEMADSLVLQLTDKGLVTDSLTLDVCYDRENCDNGKYRGPVHIDHYGRTVPKGAHGSTKLDNPTNLGSILISATTELFERIADKTLTVRRITIAANRVVKDEGFFQVDLFTDTTKLEKEKKLQNAMLGLKKKFGKNAVLKGTNYLDGATMRERNQLSGRRYDERKKSTDRRPQGQVRGENMDYKNTPEGRSVQSKYGKILHASRPEPPHNHPRMPMSNRAKIFSPFAALRGYGDEIASEGRDHLKGNRIELSEEGKQALSQKISQLRKGQELTIKYFTDGYYENITGILDAVDAITKELRIYTGFINDTGKELPTIIAFEDILEIGVNMT